MKIKEIIEALSPEMEKRKKADFEKAKANYDWSRRSRPSRLRGKGRGTARADQSIKEV